MPRSDQVRSARIEPKVTTPTTVPPTLSGIAKIDLFPRRRASSRSFAASGGASSMRDRATTSSAKTLLVSHGRIAATSILSGVGKIPSRAHWWVAYSMPSAGLISATVERSKSRASTIRRNHRLISPSIWSTVIRTNVVDNSPKKSSKDWASRAASVSSGSPLAMVVWAPSPPATRLLIVYPSESKLCHNRANKVNSNKPARLSHITKTPSSC